MISKIIFSREEGSKREDESPTNSDILKSINSMNQSLKGEMLSVQSKVAQIASKINKVESDLQSYENRWEARMETGEGRIFKLEKNKQSLENRWELHRSDQSKELSIIQTGIDSNSAAVLDLQNKAKINQGKWDNLEELEQKIKKAADKKFQALKNIITTELREEIKEEIKAEIKEETIKEVRSYVAPSTNKIKAGLQVIENKILKEVQSTKTTEYERMKDKAIKNRQNLIVLGLREEHSPQADTWALLSFFKERMDLPNIELYETSRMGRWPDRGSPRPLAVKLKNIQDRWAVWNRKGSIRKVKGYTVWIQEDLPKKLREDNRVFSRIAKTAKLRPDIYQDVRVQDFNLILNGTTYTHETINSLPPDLKPETVYTPRSAHTCVFFTKHSPLSNHHPSSFQLEGHTFVCVEQFLAFNRAQLSGDEVLAKAAMDQQEPAEHKVILNTLRPNQPEVWKEKAKDYILQI